MTAGNPAIEKSTKPVLLDIGATQPDNIFHLFQGIPYSYDRTPPGINCFDLAQTVRSRFNAPPLPNFDMDLVSYPTERELPNDRVLHLLQEYCLPVVDAPATHLDLLALRLKRWIGLGTVVVDSGRRYVVFMDKGRSVVVPLEELGRKGTIDSVWRYAG